MQWGQYEKITSIASNAKMIFCMDSLIAHMHRTLIKAIGCVADVIAFYTDKHQLTSMTSNRSHLVKCLMVLLVLQFNREIRYQRNHWLRM